MTHKVSQAQRLEGTIALPADKSVAHRAALFAALARGESVLSNYPAGGDPQSTLSCLRQLGVEIAYAPGGALSIAGRGLEGLRPAPAPLDCGNSGTTMRLLSGILAGLPFSTILVGDGSLSRRPMARIARPLEQMGARVRLTDGHAPINVDPTPALREITYRLPVPSAQVKSCILLAGLFNAGSTTVIESIPSRDHTERMLGLPVKITNSERYITSSQHYAPQPTSYTLPRDFSAAAFFLVATSMMSIGKVTLPAVGLNPTRTGLLDVLRAMGADVRVSNESTAGGEPIGDLTVHPAELTGITIRGALIPRLIDEIPILAVAGALAHGKTVIRDAQELRLKECDRIQAMVTNLRSLGGDVEEFDDGLAITGGRSLTGTDVGSFGDHRIAMAMGIAGLVAHGQTRIHDAEVASVSFPEFWVTLDSLT